MIFKELLDSVSFDEVERQIRIMYNYPETGNLGWYKIHFDMLRLLTPKHHDDANDDVCHITMEDWENGNEPHLHAFPMEGDLWEHSLTKEIVIAPDVKASNEEIAACCLWHTSFHGFVEEDRKKRFRLYDIDIDFMDRWDDDVYFEKYANKNFSIIRKNGGMIPTIKDLSPKRKKQLIYKLKESRWYRGYRSGEVKLRCAYKKHLAERYYRRMTDISDFIVKAIPAINDKANDNYLKTEDLCSLFQSELFYSEELTSFADEGTSGAKYLLNLILIYDMLPHFDRMIYILTTGEPIETMTEDDLALQNVLMGSCKSGDIIFATNPSLGRQIRINYATFNTRYPLIR
ncbi:MAG: hypothetical protein IKP36_12525 [Bacteroidaceae bacterium]|nr:hypothetical protein [Bacteroidaceae bacterium]